MLSFRGIRNLRNVCNIRRISEPLMGLMWLRTLFDGDGGTRVGERMTPQPA